MVHTTYTEARANLARLWDTVAEDRETVIITRRGSDDVALISAAELRSLLETAHLLRSPRNAERLLSALESARMNKGRTRTIAQLERSVLKRGAGGTEKKKRR